MTDATSYAGADDLVGGADVDDAEDLVLPSGRRVRVRGLSRYEWFLAAKNSPDGEPNLFETQVVAMGLVIPAMTAAQVDRWRKRPGSYGDLSAVHDRIRPLTGVDEGAQKSDVREVREQPE